MEGKGTLWCLGTCPVHVHMYCYKNKNIVSRKWCVCVCVRLCMYFSTTSYLGDTQVYLRMLRCFTYIQSSSFDTSKCVTPDCPLTTSPIEKVKVSGDHGPELIRKFMETSLLGTHSNPLNDAHPLG